MKRITQILLMTLLFSSCHPMGKEIQRVLGDSTARETVWHEVNKYKRPNDTVKVIIPGRVDTMYQQVIIPVSDTSSLRIYRDSLMKVYSGCDDAVRAATDACYSWYENELSKIRKVKVPVKQPDTAVNNIYERGLISSLEERLIKANLQISRLNGQLSEKDNQIASEKKKANDRLYYIIGLSAVLVIYAAYKIFKTIKNPLA